jgi:hypothetical protein
MKFWNRPFFKVQPTRIAQHTGFWLLTLTTLTLIYGFGLPSYWVAFQVILMFLPIHCFYFYTVAYFGLPRYLFRRNYLKFFLFLTLCMILSMTAFRLLEILVADPWILQLVRKTNPDFVWRKLEGSFWEQFLNPTYIANAFEQTNFILWIALAIKFFKMWYEKQQAALEAELGLLKGQLHPHFLFNTLNNLYALTLTQSPRSPSVVIGLSEILRYMLYEANSESVELKRDVQILENYIALEKIRYEERLDLNMSVKGISDHHRIVPLLILPLVENAFKHGTSEKIGEAWINLDLHVKGNMLKFKISNSKAEVAPKRNGATDHTNIGLTNVRKRLQILYPAAHKLRILEEEDIFVVILEIDLDKRLAIGPL